MVNLKTIISILHLVCFSLSVTAQTTDDYKLAVNVLKGKTDIKTQEWAIQTLENISDSLLKPRALNVIGMVYSNGIGVDVDTTIAVSKFEESANLGYVDAYHNLGLLYKNAKKDTQDFVKAFNYFKKGVSAQSIVCMYDVGYMLYKGLGCEQNYKKAVEHFQKGAKFSEPASMYMLGLCYRNGYGIERNEDSAKFYLEESSKYNYRFANEELKRKVPEYQEDYFTDSIDICYLDAIDQINTKEIFMINKNELYGSYEGIIITYDWSGERIIKKENLKVILSKSLDRLNGIWIQGIDSLCFHARLEDYNRVVFDNAIIKSKDRYNDSKKINFQFEDVQLSLINNSLSGKLNVYSLLLNEPERPMYICLNKISGKDSTIKNKIAMSAIPRSNSTVQIDFQSPLETNQAEIIFYSKTGLALRKYKYDKIKSGSNCFMINHNLPNDTYLITLSVDNYHGDAIITY